MVKFWDKDTCRAPGHPNHVWHVRALPYLLTVLDCEGRSPLWDSPPANALVYHMVVADVMAACAGTWGWLGTTQRLSAE